MRGSTRVSRTLLSVPVLLPVPVMAVALKTYKHPTTSAKAGAGKAGSGALARRLAAGAGSQQPAGRVPAAPYSAIAPPSRPVHEPPADNENVQSLLDTQLQQADQAGTGVTQAAFAGLWSRGLRGADYSTVEAGRNSCFFRCYEHEKETKS